MEPRPEPHREADGGGHAGDDRMPVTPKSTSHRGNGLVVTHRHVTLPPRPPAAGEAGFSTAELLGNAALGIAALVAIWALLEALGVSVVAWIGAQLGLP